jgi:hypothetical protein
MSVELPKTEASEAPVPVIAPLRKILDAWKTKTTIIDDCWIFQLEPWYVGPIILNIRGHREPAADRGWMTGNSHLTVAVLL